MASKMATDGLVTIYYYYLFQKIVSYTSNILGKFRSNRLNGSGDTQC